MAGRKTVDHSKNGIEKLPVDKPVVYKILTDSGRNNYTGTAQRGRAQERVAEHLPGGKDYVPGSKVHVQQFLRAKCYAIVRKLAAGYTT